MKSKQSRLLFILLLLIFSVGCQAEPAAEGTTLPAATTDTQTQDVADTPMAESEPDPTAAAATPAGEETVEPQSAPEATFTPAVEATAEVEAPGSGLPMLPAFQQANTNGIGEPLPGGENDPFAEAAFTLETELPDGPATAVVEEHSFGQMDEAAARELANQFGFSGPLYVQQIAPEFAPPEGAAAVFTAFDGRRILNISDNGLTMEDRGVIIDYNDRPSFAEAAPLIEAQLKSWGLLDFPYELEELEGGDVLIKRLIDGIPTNQNEFGISINREGEVGYFDYRPLRQVNALGQYPLQTAEMAWQQIQDPRGREGIRYQIWPLPVTGEDPLANFVNPRSWTPAAQPGQELHLYMTPAVYEATDGSGLHLVYGDFTLTGDEEQLAAIAGYLADVLHVWGTAGLDIGAKTLNVEGWEETQIVNYETLEGTVSTEDGQTLLQTTAGETFILAAAPDDIPDGTEVYASVMARRDAGAAYPILDWNSLTEKIDWPEAPVAAPPEEPGPITEVRIDSAELIYFTLFQSVDVPQQGTSLLFMPVWQFTGETEQGQKVNFWVPAVVPEYLE